MTSNLNAHKKFSMEQVRDKIKKWLIVWSRGTENLVGENLVCENLSCENLVAENLVYGKFSVWKI